MKTILSLLIGLTTASSAVTLALSGFANTSVGLITSWPAPSPSGRAIFISTTTDIGYALYNELFYAFNDTSEHFDLRLANAIGGSSPTSPGIIRTATFADGTLSYTGTAEFGNVGNYTYMILVAEQNGYVIDLGAYTGANVPSSGEVTFTPATTGGSIGLGYPGINFQLAMLPEPSTVLLSMLGSIVMLMRRKR